MKNLIIILFFMVCYFITSCSNDEELVYGSGNLITESRTVDSFSEINSSGVFDITVVQGQYQSLEIIADHNIMRHVRTRVSGNELQLFLDDYNYRHITLRANITTTELNSIKNRGIGDMSVSAVQSNNFTIDNSGTGDITIQGNVQNTEVYNEGSGNIFGFNFLTNNCIVEIIGSGSVETLCSNNLSVDIQGSGIVYYKGNPQIEVDIEGSGEVINSN